MKKYSENRFELKSQLSSSEIIARLREHTLMSRLLVMVLTDKDFIGRINEESFAIISSSFFMPYGALCVIKGNVNGNSTVTLVTTLHNVFRILFIVWLIGMTVLFGTFWVIDSASVDLLPFVFGMPICAFLFRLFLHGMYVLARNQGLQKIRKILEVAD